MNRGLDEIEKALRAEAELPKESSRWLAMNIFTREVLSEFLEPLPEVNRVPLRPPWTAAADGPIPIGDAAAVILLAGVGIYSFFCEKNEVEKVQQCSFACM